MIYFILETQKRLLYPYSQYLNSCIQLNGIYEKAFTANPISNFFQAKNELAYEFIRDYKKPVFGFTTIEKDNVQYEINEEIVVDDVFCDLIHFTKTPENKHKKPLLIVAPLSGHYATLLRDTVKAGLLDYEVYVTDWKNCRDIPLSNGDFGFDDYVLYVKKYTELLKKQYGEVHLLAVCQPTVPVLCATALLEKEKSPYYPDTVVLMGGPVDTRQSPTEVNKYALKNDINWFKKNVIDTVPVYFKGSGRKVYPGFLQYSGFVAMNFKRHTDAHLEFFNNLLKGSDLNADKHRKFYEEYNSVMDLPANYYLQTLERIFLDQHLAKDKMVIAGEKISLKDITRVKILTIEG
jgi:poly(3-hydroxybutyrate) depolymerase